MIVDAEAAAVNKMAEVDATKTMINWVEAKFTIKPQRLVGDTNYGIAAMLGWLVDEKRITLQVTEWDKSEHHGTNITTVNLGIKCLPWWQFYCKLNHLAWTMRVNQNSG